MNIIQKSWKAWRAFAKIVGNFQARIIFTVFYFLILWTIGLVSAYASDPLNIKKKHSKSNFSAWDHPDETIHSAQNPY